MASNLEACPFCGEPDPVPGGMNGVAWFECSRCFARGPLRSALGAHPVITWNHRVPNPHTKEMVRLLAKAAKTLDMYSIGCSKLAVQIVDFLANSNHGVERMGTEND